MLGACESGPFVVWWGNVTASETFPLSWVDEDRHEGVCEGAQAQHGPTQRATVVDPCRQGVFVIVSVLGMEGQSLCLAATRSALPSAGEANGRIQIREDAGGHWQTGRHAPARRWTGPCSSPGEGQKILHSPPMPSRHGAGSPPPSMDAQLAYLFPSHASPTHLLKRRYHGAAKKNG